MRQPLDPFRFVVIALAGSRVFDLNSSANPGDFASIWGTGLGPASFRDDDVPQPIDMKDVQVHVTVGAQSAEIVYRGRSGCCAGVDQIVFRVPSHITGCYVPLSVTVDDIKSNTVTLPITTAADRVCADSSWLSGTDLQAMAGKNSFSLGYQSLTRGENSQGDDTGVSTFYRFNTANYDFSLMQPESSGFCEVTVQTTPFNWPPVTAPRLDAGGAISITGPKGIKQMPKTDNLYLADFGTGYFVPGAYTLSNGSGGSNIGPFRLDVTVPQPFVWTNRDSSGVVLRSQGVTLRWTGGDPDGTILIIGTVAKGRFPGPVTVTQFNCHALARDGQFTVPPRIVKALPADDAGTLALGAETNQVRFSALGLDLGFASFYEQLTRTVAYR